MEQDEHHINLPNSTGCYRFVSGCYFCCQNICSVSVGAEVPFTIYCSTFSKNSVVLEGANIHHFSSIEDTILIVQKQKGIIKNSGTKERIETIRDKARKRTDSNSVKIRDILPLLVILITTKPYQKQYTPLHVGVVGIHTRECQRNNIIRQLGL